MHLRAIRVSFAIGFFFFAACKQENKKEPVLVKSEQVAIAPDFNADSAYAFVSAQCAFGPRVPGTQPHAACGDYLERQLRRFSRDVTVQEGRVRTYNGVNLSIKNYIARFNTSATKRILLFAHWDTRPWADRDSVRRDEPILGADDAASGVGILLEVARALSQREPETGVDIAFFDAEDYGTRAGEANDEDSYALGTQYWCRNPLPHTRAAYGILLDMVGARNAQFSLEGYSRQYAPSVQENVWTTANRLGYGRYFNYLEGGFITDDHLYVNRIAGIPSIDIIHTSTATPTGFAPHWHTHADNMDLIDRGTLKAVGQTLLEVIYVAPAL